MSTEFAMLSRAQRRGHVARVKEMLEEQERLNQQERSGVSFADLWEEEEEEEGKDAQVNVPKVTVEEDSEHSTILRREVSALQMKIEKLKGAVTYCTVSILRFV